MTTARWAILGGATLAVVGCAVLLATGRMPLGIEGEWTWGRSRFAPRPLDVALASAGVVAFATFVAIGVRALTGPVTRVREAAAVLALFLASIAAQVAVQAGGPDGHGLTKWSTLDLPGSSGYFGVARREMADPWRFWADYPRWIRGQDALHIGTHPPGLFLASRGVLGLMRGSPGVTKFVTAATPPTVAVGFSEILVGIPRSEKAAVALMGALTLLMCSATVIPLYILARASQPPGVSFAAAALWAIAPSPILFQPTADTAFPLLSTAALALAACGGPAGAMLAGAVLAVGMQFTLAFLPVGLIVALVHLGRPGSSPRGRAWRLAETGAGFISITVLLWAASSANPMAIWWSNQANHARFYRENPRSYVAWIVANPVELAVALGLPTTIAAIAGFARRGVPPSAWGTAVVLVVLNLSGKNLSEVARLWLIFMPGLCVAAGHGLERVARGAREVGWLVALVGFQTLALQSTIQVVYPV